MIGVQDLRKGVTFELDNSIYRVLSYEHIKAGRGNATIRIKARDLRSGAIIERTFPSGNKVQDVRLDHATVQYLYNDGDLYTFMDVETYEQPVLSKAVLGDAVNYLKEGMTLEIVSYQGEPLDIELPTTVDLEVTYTEPGFAGDTATGAMKLAETETGLKVQVPLFVEIGDIIRVDTRTGEYVTRVN
ncbi:MAG: elongation factor P [Caldilineales bacterium]|nr:elongation factor P [Caldilineales bacterium]MDW8318572.1 elongation factor P [Anaerolineae bacterium]